MKRYQKPEPKDGLSMLEIILVSFLGLMIFAITLHCYSNVRSGKYTTDDVLRPKESAARSQRLILEEMKRANDLKEQELKLKQP